MRRPPAAGGHDLGGDGLSNDPLNMTGGPPRDVLLRTGFASAEPVRIKGGLALHRAQ